MQTSIEFIGPSATNLILDRDGIWKSRQAGTVYYPADGSRNCFQLEEKSLWFKHRNDCIIAAVKLFPPKGPILDIGGGNGFVTRRLLDEGYDSLLLEPSPEGCGHAKNARKIPGVICSRFEDAGFTPESLSAIGLFDVLEHIPDDKGFIDRAFRALRPEGIIYMTVPAFKRLWSKSDSDAMHFRRYDRPSIEKLFATKFKILYFTYFYCLLALPVFFIRTIPFRLKLIRSINLLSAETEHSFGSGCLAKVIGKTFPRELKKISSGIGMILGTSCLIVAQKKPETFLQLDLLSK